ncbi:endonuclease domain-containing protein [Streptomyces sp. NPDC056463]|uniref:endonuclease domain-containing protein n=1 Tax=Streptomyces sp. NPDC056463 TaxID=3345827 RepID=UPI0036CEA7FE
MRGETEELVRVARGGVLLTVWAYGAGWSRGRATRRLRADGWQRICQGAWAAPGKEVDWRVRARAHQLLRPELVCSHGTAAALHRIEVLGGIGGRGVGVGVGPPVGLDGPEVLDFTVPRPGRSSRTAERVRVHSTEFLAAGDCVMRGGLRATGPARTVGDLIRSCGTREHAVVVADSALSRRTVRGVRREPLVHREELVAELSAPRPGATRARRWLPFADPACGSPAETVARLRMRDAGLRPESQPLLHTRGGRSLRPDFLFRAHGLAVEIEGYAFHGSRQAHDRDIRRYNDLADCPEVRRVLRFTARDVFFHPEAMVATIVGVLGQLGT